MKILIGGSTGMLGSSMMLSNTKHELWGAYLGDKPKAKNNVELDISDALWVNRVLNEIKPDVIINTIAITNVDLCEEKPEFARKIHVLGTKNLLEYAKEKKIYFLNISTDSVFDGNRGNYTEEDTPNPLNMYAKSKLEGDILTLQYPNTAIARTNIFGFNWLKKQSIAEWIIDTLKKKKELKLFKDVYFTPILTNILADLLFKMAEKGIQGLYNVTGSESISKLEFGYRIAKIYNLDSSLIKPSSIRDIGLKAIRPLIPTLVCSKIEKLLKVKLPNVDENLQTYQKIESTDYLARLKNL